MNTDFYRTLNSVLLSFEYRFLPYGAFIHEGRPDQAEALKKKLNLDYKRK